MFKDSARGDLNGFLDAGSHINGELHFEDTFRVDGTLTGKVVSKGDLVVGEQGQVDGDVQVGRVFVSGVVRGSISAASRAEFTAGGKVYADVETPTLIVEEGAHFEGNCRMTLSPGKAATGPGVSGKVHRLPVGGENISS
jgi:cytoskeletal protein CcmA (bactofilin family)